MWDYVFFYIGARHIVVDLSEIIEIFEIVCLGWFQCPLFFCHILVFIYVQLVIAVPSNWVGGGLLITIELKYLKLKKC